MKRRDLWPVHILTTVLLIVSATLVATAAKVKSDGNPGYAISISTNHNPVKLGQPVNVHIKVTVIGTEPISWRVQKRATQYKAFHFLLQKEGVETQKTKFNKILRGEESPDDLRELGGSSVVLTMKPGESLDFDVDITRLYNIASPGSYTLTAERITGTEKPVFSNTLTIMIDP